MNIFHTLLKTLAVLAVTFAAALVPLSYAQRGNTAMPSIQFLDKTYHLAWTSDPTSSQRSVVYLLEGEIADKGFINALSVDQEEGVSMTNAVSYFLEIAGPEVLDTDSNLLNQIEKLNTEESLLLFMFNEHDKERVVITESNGREIFDRIIDRHDVGDVFLVLVSKEHNKARDEIIWSWTVTRYSSMQTADGKQVLRRLGYTKQHYGNDGVSDFLKAIDVDNPRSEIINAVITAQIPQIP